MIKVAILQPYYQTIGGTEKNALKIAHELNRHFGQALIITPGHGPFTEMVEREQLALRVITPPAILDLFGGQYFSFGIWSIVRFLAGFFCYNLRLAQVLRQEKVNLVIFNHVRAPVIMGLAPKLIDIPTALYLRDDFPKGLSRFEPLIRWWLVRSADRIISVSQETFEAFARNLPAQLRREAYQKLTVVYNWLPDIPIKLTCNRGRDVHHPIRIGTLANIVRRKGIHHLVDMARLLRERSIEFEIRVAGAVYDEIYYANVKRQIEALDLSKIVRFCGFVPTYEFLSELDIFVLASDREGMPMAILEAMQVGIPIVAFAAEGVKEALGNGEAGRVVPIGDVNGLTNEVITLVENANLRQQLAERARARSRLFSRETQVKRLIEVLTDVMHS